MSFFCLFVFFLYGSKGFIKGDLWNLDCAPGAFVFSSRSLRHLMKELSPPGDSFFFKSFMTESYINLYGNVSRDIVKVKLVYKMLKVFHVEFFASKFANDGSSP